MEGHAGSSACRSRLASCRRPKVSQLSKYLSVTDSLLRIARDENVDLIGAGAYGHSRLGEWVFGGVTRELLVKSPVCCLFSH